MRYYVESGRDLIGTYASLDKAKEAKEELLQVFGMNSIIVCSDGTLIK